MKVRAVVPCQVDGVYRAQGDVFHTNHPMTPGVLAEADAAVEPHVDPRAGEKLRELLVRGALGGTPIIPAADPTAPLTAAPAPVSVQLPETAPGDEVSDLLT